MIYELRNKIPQNSSLIYSEDVLTSTIFGNLRYLQTNNVLNDFLSEAINLQGERLIINHEISSMFHFWEKYINKNTVQINEPDLVIDDGKNVTIVECKYHSLLDEKESNDESDYTNQLIRYSTIFNDYYPNRVNKNIIFLTLKDYQYKDIFKKTESKIPKNIGLYWLCWEKLLPCLKKYIVKSYNEKEHILINDLIAFIQKRNLYFFSGFSVNHSYLKWDYKKNYCFNSISVEYIWRYKSERDI